jgi:hypothetical protein
LFSLIKQVVSKRLFDALLFSLQSVETVYIAAGAAYHMQRRFTRLTYSLFGRNPVRRALSAGMNTVIYIHFSLKAVRNKGELIAAEI